VTHRGDMGEEGVKLLVSVENTLLCQIISRLDRTHTLAPRLLIDRLDTAIRRDRRVARSVRGHCHPQDWVDSSITLHTDSLPLRAGRAEPQNPVEATLARIWSDLLGNQAPVGVHDNLFALGGHSLTATRFVARVADTYGVSLPVHHVFATPTIAELAEAVSADPDFEHAAGSSRHAELDALSDEDLDDLLRAALAQRNRRRAGTSGFDS
jgi:hypothetical protein